MRNERRTGAEGYVEIDLTSCLVQVEASKSWFARRVLPLSLEQLRWRPDPLHWSIAECLDHLNVTLGLYLPKIEQAVESGARNGWNGRLETREAEVLKRIEPPVESRVEAPPATNPSTAVDPDDLVEGFYLTRDHYAEAVRRAGYLDLANILIVEPVYPLIRTLGGTLGFLAAHDRRHMWQAERLRNESRFPRAVFTSK